MGFFKKKQNMIMIVIIAVVAVIAIGIGVKIHQGNAPSNMPSAVVEQEGSLPSEEDLSDTLGKISYKNGVLQIGGSESGNETIVDDNSVDIANDDKNTADSNNKNATTGGNKDTSTTGNNQTANTDNHKNDTTSSSTGTNNQTSNSNSENSNTNSENNSSDSGNEGSNGTNPTVPPVQEKTLICYVTIRCDTILNNMGNLAAGHDSFVPSSGYLLSKKAITFEEGETAFDVTKRACANAGLSIEYSWAAIYDSYYVEGINNLHEFDCGGESGWMYKVNGWFPNYGCSKYEVKDGDNIVWCYTCNGLGADVGGSNY